MNELYFPEAIVLDREDANGFDSRYSIYAKGFGKFLAKATSARKITSKLAPHLEPGNLVQIRVVGNGNFQVVDVLKSKTLDVRCPDLYLLNQLLPEHDFEFSLWKVLTEGSPSSQARSRLHQDFGGQAGREPFDWKKIDSSPSGLPSGQVRQNLNWRKVLSVLGWDPEEAICEICGEKPDFFDIGTQGFFCENCFNKKGNLDMRSLRRVSKDFIGLVSS